MNRTQKLEQLAKHLRESADWKAQYMTAQAGGKYELRDSDKDALADLAEEVLMLRREMFPLES